MNAPPSTLKPFAISCAGRVWVRILVLISALGILVSGLLIVLSQFRAAADCKDNLRAIFRALEHYELERGVLPTLAFYPDQPMEDSDSLRVVLEPYGLAGSRCLCPQARPILRKEGLTYLWNTRLNGQRIPRGGDAVWMLVDLHALSDEVPAPHFGRYHALFSDGSVRLIRNPRSELPGL